MDNLSNCFLIASQDLMEGFFEKKVIYILEHNPEEGVLGFAINHPLRSIKIRALMDYFSLNDDKNLNGDFLDKQLTLYQGGPANVEKAFILRSYLSPPFAQKQEGQEIDEGQNKLSLVQSSDELQSILLNATFEKHFFAFGYSGWTSQQLEKEIELGFWHIAPFNENIVFNASDDNPWEIALNSINLDPNYLAGGLGHA